MMLTLAVLAGFFVQGMIAVNHPRLGAVFGFVITTGVLVYGLYSYSKGGVIVLVAWPLSRPMFVAFCVAWYIWDAVQLAQTRR